MRASRLHLIAGVISIAGTWPAGYTRAESPAMAAAPAADSAPYFPLTAGATWKYQVSVKVDGTAQKPFVQTITAGEAVDVCGAKPIPLDDVAYVLKPDGVYVIGHREGARWAALTEPQKIVPLRPRTSEAWNFTAGQDSTYSTCLGSQTIKTPAGDFETQCVFSSTAGGAAGETRRQTYRYFARDVGPVRETISETTRTADGKVISRETTRDLLSFTAGGVIEKPVEVIRVAGGVADADAEEQFTKARKLAGTGDHRAAVDAYSIAIKSSPANPTIRAYKAASLVVLRDLDAAQLEIDEAIKRDDKSAIVYEVAGQIRIARNEVTAGRALYDKAAQIAPKEAGAIYTDLAATLAARRDDHLSDAIDTALKSAASADPPSPEALFQLGQSYANAGRPEAKGYLQRYVDLTGKLPPAERDNRRLRLAQQLLRALSLTQP